MLLEYQPRVRRNFEGGLSVSRGALSDGRSLGMCRTLCADLRMRLRMFLLRNLLVLYRFRTTSTRADNTTKIIIYTFRLGSKLRDHLTTLVRAPLPKVEYDWSVNLTSAQPHVLF